MRISKILFQESNLNINQQKTKNVSAMRNFPSQSVDISSLAFRAKNFAEAKEIEKLIKLSYNIDADFAGNAYLAKRVRKMTGIMEYLFGRDALPKTITHEPNKAPGNLGTYNCVLDAINYNSLSNEFDSFFKSKLGALKAWRGIFPDDFSSLHSAHIIAHEFAHSAHWHHWADKLGLDEAYTQWVVLSSKNLPKAVGRLIMRYKLGNYAVDSIDSAEYMAERISKDVCKSIREKSLKWGFNFRTFRFDKKPDVGYDNIFERKWCSKYLCPQAYLDYYTQHIWNGDLAGAEKVVKDIEKFLAAEKQAVTENEISNPLKNNTVLKSETKKSKLPLLSVLAVEYKKVPAIVTEKTTSFAGVMSDFAEKVSVSVKEGYKDIKYNISDKIGDLKYESRQLGRKISGFFYGIIDNIESWKQKKKAAKMEKDEWSFSASYSRPSEQEPDIRKALSVLEDYSYDYRTCKSKAKSYIDKIQEYSSVLPEEESTQKNKEKSYSFNLFENLIGNLNPKKERKLTLKL